MFQYNSENLYNTMAKTLDFCQVDYGPDGLNKNLSAWKRKKELVEVLRRHPDWNEDAMAIITTETYTEMVNEARVTGLCDRIYSRLCNDCRSWSNAWGDAILWREFASKTITAEMAERLNHTSKQYAKASVGQKTSRYIRQLLLGIGVPEDRKEVWELYNQLADEINADNRVVTNPLVISVNPADYLTMSYGTNWASCHIINPDIANTELNSDYEGCYKAGCLSYLGDESAVITYTVREIPEDVTLLPQTPRLTRQMFFVNTHNELPVLLQSRMYPYANHTAMIDARRAIMQGVLAECYALQTTWKDVSRILTFSTWGGSLHYRDYECFNANTTCPDELDAATGDFMVAKIGYFSYCLNCGDRVYENKNVLCDDCGGNTMEKCYECGYEGDRENMHYIDGRWYCEDCCFWCEYHEEWEVGSCDDYSYVTSYGQVCDDALRESGDFFYDEDWSEWLRRRDYPNYVITEDGTAYRDAETAMNNDYMPCEECGEWHYVGNMHERIDGGYVCRWCYRNTNREACPHCGATYNTECDVTCPNCGVIINSGEAV